MKKTLTGLLFLVVLGLLLAGGGYLWSQRPWRVAVSVNERHLVWSELDLRAQTLLDDARRTEHLMMPKEREAEALQYYRKQAARMWIVKEVMLGEALARGCEVSPGDEKEALARATARLKSRHLTADQFFKEGPLPEDLKRRDFREGILITKFTDREIRDKINLTAKEIDERQQNLKKLDLLQTKPGEKSRIKSDRKTAMDTLRAERFQKGFQELFDTLYQKSRIQCLAFPELEQLDGLSPRRTEAFPTAKSTAMEKK